MKNELFSQEFWERSYLNTTTWLIETLPSILITLVLLWISLRLLKALLKKLNSIWIRHASQDSDPNDQEQFKRIDTLTKILAEAGRLLVIGIFLIVLLGKFGVSIGPILAGAGIIGLAVGFGAQELVRDYITGFFMLLENQIRVGDVAIINGTGGLVESIELRITTLRDLSGVVHIFQNGKINTISNMTKEWSAMLFDFGIAYKEDVDKVISVIKDTAGELQNDPSFGPDIIEPLEVFGVDSFGDSAVVIKCRLKTKPSKQWSCGREFNRRIKYAFDREGIEIPFPHRTIYWGDEIDPLKLKVEDYQKQH